MKKLIVEEVNAFRAEVRNQARAAAQVRRQDRCYIQTFHPPQTDSNRFFSLPIPTRDEILNSPIREYAPANGATSAYTAPVHQRPPSPIMDEPNDDLERELAATLPAVSTR
jgi:hypothetical protein